MQILTILLSQQSYGVDIFNSSYLQMRNLSRELLTNLIRFINSIKVICQSQGPMPLSTGLLFCCIDETKIQATT